MQGETTDYGCETDFVIMSNYMRTSSTDFLAGLVVVFNGEFFYDVVLL